MEYESQNIYSDPAVVQQMENAANAIFLGARDLIVERGKTVIAHFDRIIVLDGVVLGLSFTAIKAANVPNAHIHPHLLQAAWLCLIGSILTALFFNLFTILGLGAIADFHLLEVTSVHMTLLAAVIRRGGAENNDRLAALKSVKEELPMELVAKLERFSKGQLRSASICGLFAQMLTAVGLVTLAVYFMSLTSA